MDKNTFYIFVREFRYYIASKDDKNYLSEDDFIMLVLFVSIHLSDDKDYKESFLFEAIAGMLMSDKWLDFTKMAACLEDFLEKYPEYKELFPNIQKFFKKNE